MKYLRQVLFVFGIILVLGGAGVWAGTSYLNSQQRDKALVYSNNAELLELYNSYKETMIEPGSKRTFDKSQNNITTSESQSYTMLRAVWMDDRTTFDDSWTFTRDNLQRKTDNLFSWKYGQTSPGVYGILTADGGQNTASDADVDIALSLLMAYKRWNEPAYLIAARPIITGIWLQEVVQVNGKPLLVANQIEQNNQRVLINPSYFAPYAYRLFAIVDPAHDWTGLLNNGYALIDSLSADTLGDATSSGLPPNWALIDKSTGVLSAPSSDSNLTTDYGYDAFRLPWRLALDHQWNNDPRDMTALEKMSFLTKQWEQNDKLAATYDRTGIIKADYESPAMYGTALGYFSVVDTVNAEDVYLRKLQTLYSPDRQSWKTPLAYYEDNWAWFGIALYQRALPNLAVESK